MNEIEKRRRARQAISAADDYIVEIDKRMRAGNGRARDVPPLEPTAEQIAADRMQAITLNVEWVSAALNHSRSEGWGSCIDAWQDLIDYANNHPLGHRQAFDDVVTDATLRKVLYDAIAAI
jgi:hypothetical protein